MDTARKRQERLLGTTYSDNVILGFLTRRKSECDTFYKTLNYELKQKMNAQHRMTVHLRCFNFKSNEAKLYPYSTFDVESSMFDIQIVAFLR